MHTRCYEAAVSVFTPQAPKECLCCTRPVGEADLRAHVVLPFAHHNELICRSCAIDQRYETAETNAENALIRLKRDAIYSIRERNTDIMSAEAKSLETYSKRQKTLKFLMKELEASFKNDALPMKRPLEQFAAEIAKIYQGAGYVNDDDCGCESHIANKFESTIMKDKFKVIWQVAGIISQNKEHNDTHLIANMKKKQMNACHDELLAYFWHPNRLNAWKHERLGAAWE